MSERFRVPEVRQAGLRPLADTEDDSRRDISPTPMPKLPRDLPDGTGRSRRRCGRKDTGHFGNEWLRADAERLGYIPPGASGHDTRRGLNNYFRDAGILPGRAYRLIGRYEVTESALSDADRAEMEKDCGD